MAKIDNLMPTGGGAMMLAVGASHRELRSSGSGGKSKNSSGPGIHYTGETFSDSTRDEYSTGLRINPLAIAAKYKDCEGSLYWLHAKQRIAWPYDVMCLGDSEEQSDDLYLTQDETQEIMALLYSVCSNSELAQVTGMSRARLSNYKRGASRAPIELRDIAEKLKKAA